MSSDCCVFVVIAVAWCYFCCVVLRFVALAVVAWACVRFGGCPVHRRRICPRAPATLQCSYLSYSTYRAAPYRTV